MRQIPFGKPMIGKEEIKAVEEVLLGTTLVHGPRAKEFEKAFAQYTGAQHAVTVSSCTAGLHLVYHYLGIRTGDEVIVPAQTHTATAHAVEFCGGKPVFVDAEKYTGNVDINQIKRLITARTKAISIVHFLGMPVNMEEIMGIAGEHRLFVVEDCALALGSIFRKKHAGLHGDVGVFSFYPAKHLTTSEGGMIVTKHENLAKKISRLKAFGVDADLHERKIPGVYDVTMLGYNYRMSEIQAAIGIEQIKRAAGFAQAREENYRSLSEILGTIDEVSQLETTHGDFVSSYYCHTMLLNEGLIPKRTDIINGLRELGVGTSVYYPKPVPHLGYYREKYGYGDKTYPNASRISYGSIALPVGPHLTPNDMQYIGQSLKTVFRKMTSN